MLGSRAMALVRLGRIEEAAQWAVKPPRVPTRTRTSRDRNVLLALAGRIGEASDHLASLRRDAPQYGVDDLRWRSGSSRKPKHYFDRARSGSALSNAGAKKTQRARSIG